MKALHILAGAGARRHIESNGLSPRDVQLIPGAAGGPKGLIVNHLDRHIFGHWLRPHANTVHLVGASIGAWRMAVAGLPDPEDGFRRFARAYIHQHVEPEPGRSFPSSPRVSAVFTRTLTGFFSEGMAGVISHPRYRLHVLAARGRHVLRRGTRRRSAVGFTGLALTNAISRKAVGLFVERTVFSTPGEALPVTLSDLPTRHVELNGGNFFPAMVASCSIPFVLEAVDDIPGAARGSHWDGGIVDYAFHWPYTSMPQGLVLYPHFQRQIVPGWLDKKLKWRHRSGPGLDNMVLLAPNPQWVARLPGGKLPDRDDFARLPYHERVLRWTGAVAEAARLADEWHEWLEKGCPASALRPL